MTQLRTPPTVDAEGGGVNRTDRRPRPPWAGIVVSAASLIVMAGVAWVLWDSLPAVVVTRESSGQRAGVSVPRAAAVAALPATLLLIAAIMVLATELGDRLRPYVDPRLVAGPDAQTRSMNALFTLLPLFLLVLHTGFLLTVSGREFPMDRVMGAAFGVLLMGFGALLQKLSPAGVAGADTLGRWTSAWQRSQRWAGTAMVALGAACAVATFLLPPVLAAVGSAALLAVIFVATLVRASRKTLDDQET
ncbi:hypothetical protein [Nonomuraea maritima]|uniref:hypothetical protein n=1 Tax=Nonomuraea maritima TaxID=683260 RepID=UPI0037204C5B